MFDNKEMTSARSKILSMKKKKCKHHFIFYKETCDFKSRFGTRDFKKEKLRI